MHWADIIAEQRVNEAARKGELSGLNGEGAPLDLSEDPPGAAGVARDSPRAQNAGYHRRRSRHESHRRTRKNWPTCPIATALHGRQHC